MLPGPAAMRHSPAHHPVETEGTEGGGQWPAYSTCEWQVTPPSEGKQGYREPGHISTAVRAGAGNSQGATGRHIWDPPVLPESCVMLLAMQSGEFLLCTLRVTYNPDGGAWLGVIALADCWLPQQKETCEGKASLFTTATSGSSFQWV